MIDANVELNRLLDQSKSPPKSSSCSSSLGGGGACFLGSSFFFYYFLGASFSFLAGPAATGAGALPPIFLDPLAMSSWSFFPLRLLMTLSMSSSAVWEPMFPRRDLMSAASEWIKNY